MPSKTIDTDYFQASKRIKNNVDEIVDISDETNDSTKIIIPTKAKDLKSSSESANIFKQIFAKSKEKAEAKKELIYDKDDFKNSSNNKDWNMKLVTWNINGIRAWIEHGGLDYIQAEDPDIFCCQEVKCDKSKIPLQAELKGYHCYWLSGVKQGYSGTGIMTKIKPLSVRYEISEKYNTEGRTIIAEYEKFILVNSYVPNSGSSRLEYRVEWEYEFRKQLNEIEKTKPLIWCGDLNVAHNEIDLANPKTSTKSPGFTKEERECFTNLLSDGYFDSFRYLYPEVTGAYTWWSYMREARSKNIGWRIDYFVLSNKLKENVADTMIRNKVTGSDHCPVALFLKI